MNNLIHICVYCSGEWVADAMNKLKEKRTMDMLVNIKLYTLKKKKKPLCLQLCSGS